VKLTAHLHLVPRLRMSGPLPLFFLYAFMAWDKFTIHLNTQILTLPIPVAVRSKAWVYGLSLVGIAGSNPDGAPSGLKPARACMPFSLVSVVCCHLKVSASGWSPVQRSPTKCGVSECNCKTSIMRRPLAHIGLSRQGKKIMPFFTENAVFIIRKTNR
jgi:hypothetical protein